MHLHRKTTKIYTQLKSCRDFEKKYIAHFLPAILIRAICMEIQLQNSVSKSKFRFIRIII